MTADSRGEVALTESAETKDEKEIQNQTRKLLAAKNYEGLDAFAKQQRDSKSFFPDGTTGLHKLYLALRLDDDASEADWKNRLAALRDWVAARRGSITARLALADALVNYAWKARGSGYASSVSNNGWNLMGQRLGEAMQILKDSASLSEKCPYRWNVLMSAGLGLQMPKPQYRAVFEKAIASEPDYATSYHKAMSYYLMRRWYGAPGELADFCQKSADKVGGEEGDILYARMAWGLTFRISGSVFDDENISWERADHGFQLIEKRYPDSIRVQNQRVYLALMGSKTKAAPRQLIAELHGKIDPEIWADKENFLSMTKNLYAR